MCSQPGILHSNDQLILKASNDSEMGCTIIFLFYFFSMPPPKKAHIQTIVSHTSQFLQALNDYRARMLKHTKPKGSTHFQTETNK